MLADSDTLEVQANVAKKKSKVVETAEIDYDDNEFLNDDSDVDDDLASLMISPSGAVNYTLADAIYLILRNDLGVDESIATLNTIRHLSAKTWGDLTRCYTCVGSGGIPATISEGIRDLPPKTYIMMEGKLVTNSGARILNYPEFIKMFIGAIPRCSQSNLCYYYNQSLIAKATDTAFIFKEIDRELISSIFGLYLEPNWEVNMDKFRILMIFCCNGLFKQRGSSVVYEMIDYRSDQCMLYDKFSVPQKLFVLRQKALQDWMQKALVDNKVTDLDYDSFDFVLRWPYLMSWDRTVRELFKTQTVIDFPNKKEKATVARNLNAFSGNNKNLRSIVNGNKNFFIHTPEFDYDDTGMNFMPRRMRNGLLRANHDTSGVADDPNKDYDWTGKGVDKIHHYVVRDFRTIMIMYTDTVEWLHLFSAAKIMVSIKCEQKHSLNLIFVNDKSTTFSAKKLGNRWYDHARKMYLGERQYMINMVAGSFVFSGTTNAGFEPVASSLEPQNEFLFGDDSDDDEEDEDEEI
jgi:hypothetical protein